MVSDSPKAPTTPTANSQSGNLGKVSPSLCISAAFVGLIAMLLASAPFLGFMLFTYPGLVFNQAYQNIGIVQGSFNSSPELIPSQFASGYTNTFGLVYYASTIIFRYFIFIALYAIAAILIGYSTYKKKIKMATSPPKSIYSFLFVFCACTANFVIGGLIAYFVLKEKKWI
jgi:hypothetical protein